MDKFCVITNIEKDKDYTITGKINDFLKNAGKSCVIMGDQPISNGITDMYTDVEKIPEDIECAIVLGGDGTMIQAANDLVNMDIPILGVNIGTLGFLTEVEKHEIENALHRLIADDYFIESRMMLSGSVKEGEKELYHGYALNDFVVTKRGICRIITIKVYVNDILQDIYRGDGLIVSTPTGSTGYNLSAGGPVLAPDMNCISITPICPHSFNNRSLVIAATDRLRIKIGQTKEMQEDEAVLTVDGNKVIDLITEKQVDIAMSKTNTKLIKLTKSRFFERMREKLNGSNRI